MVARAAAPLLTLCALPLLTLCALLATGCSCRADHEPDAKERDPNILTLRSEEPVFPWAATLRHNKQRLTATPGGVWSTEFDLRVDLRAHRAVMGQFKRLVVAIFGELRHDARGNYRTGASNYAISSSFTTTGMPIQHYEHWPSLSLIHGKNGSPLEGLTRLDLPVDVAAMHRLKGKVEVKVPAKIQPGYYQLHMALLVEVEGVDTPVYLAMFSKDWKDIPFPPFPLVKVGSPAMPILPWTAFSNIKELGRAGTLPEELRGKVALNLRAGFPTELILRPGQHPLRPGLPSVFPRGALPPLVGGQGTIPHSVETHLDLGQGEVSCQVEGPGGKTNLGTRNLTESQEDRLALRGGPFTVDMTRTGTYRVRMTGKMQDHYGREFKAGGTYKINVAYPMTFSTSCKPGTSFLVGGRYPPKVNVNPPVPAQVEVTVTYFPASDPARKRVWTARGEANRFGHFVPSEGEPILFDEPGEYRSLVRATYRDSMGRLWMGLQTSAGVVAPQDPTVTLHGARAYPRGYRPKDKDGGRKERYAEQALPSNLMMFSKPALPPSPTAPYHQQDSLFITTSGFNDIDLETRFSISAAKVPALARRILAASTLPSLVLPARFQPPSGPWRYFKDTLLRGKAYSVYWQPRAAKDLDELPVTSVARGELHPMANPGKNRVDAYLYTGSVRPGFPAMTSVLQDDGLGLYWCTNPSLFGHHINSGGNGDLVGDVYRVQAGLVLHDNDSGESYYDAYSSVVTTVTGPRPAAAVLAPGARPLVVEGGREHFIFLASDGYDVLEVGEKMYLGGMVFPNVPAKVTWTVTTPAGNKEVLVGTANRLGGVHGDRPLLTEQPGIYTVQADVRYKDLRGGVVGTREGTFWHCAVPADSEPLLSANIPPMSRISSVAKARIPLSWPASVRKVKITYGVMMPGHIIEQGVVRREQNDWTFTFSPLEAVVRIPFMDVRDFGGGHLALADTVVFQFFLEGETEDGTRVYDALRVALRGDLMLNFRGL